MIKMQVLINVTTLSLCSKFYSSYQLSDVTNQTKSNFRLIELN